MLQKTFFLATIFNKITPRLNISALIVSNGSNLKITGSIYPLVPRCSFDWLEDSVAKPKSHIIGLYLSSKSIFFGFKSKWQRPAS